MIDIHTHVLPKIDDGSASWDETEIICQQMAALGYSRIVATPHWALGMPDVPSATYTRARDLAASVGVQLSLAHECRIHPRLPEFVQQNPQLRVDGGKVVLVELPWGPVPSFTSLVFWQLVEAGYQPVLVHPARHAELWDQDSPLETLVSNNVPLQVNLSTIAGKHGKSAQQRAIWLLEQGAVSLVATDIHSAKDIDASVAHPLHLLKDLVGTDAFDTLTRRNPQSLLENRPLVNFAHRENANIIQNPALAKRLTRRDSLFNRVVDAFVR